jgi:peptidyl-prolyl cis-trans isomerase SurA
MRRSERLIRPIGPIGSIGLIALLLALPCRAVVVDRIVATVDGDPVTAFELKEFIASQVKPTAEGGMPSHDEVLDALITQRLIVKEFETLGLKVAEEDVDRYVETIRQRNKLTAEQLEQALKQQGVTMVRYREQVRDELRRAQLINREIRGKVNVTPEDVERYYQAHLEDYSTPESITISHIVLQLAPEAPPEQVAAVQQRAADLYAQLKGGADFAELARANSEDGSAKAGGSLGTFKKGEVLDVLEKATERLKPGQFSEPVRSNVGIHIVRLDERSGASHAPLEKQNEEIKQRLYNTALEERYNRWLREDLRKKHAVEILP